MSLLFIKRQGAVKVDRLFFSLSVKYTWSSQFKVHCVNQSTIAFPLSKWLREEGKNTDKRPYKYAFWLFASLWERTECDFKNIFVSYISGKLLTAVCKPKKHIKSVDSVTEWRSSQVTMACHK